MFSLAQAINELLANYTGTWCIAGGWAVDLYLDRITREHQDIEIAIPREQQQLLQGFLGSQNWHFRYVRKGTFHRWEEGIFLRLPVHEIHATLIQKQMQVFAQADHDQITSLEILLNEMSQAHWHFRRNPNVTYPIDRLIIDSKIGIPILCPEVVLLYKAKIDKPKDRADLQQLLPHLSDHSKGWLRQAIADSHPEHDWLELI